MKSATNSVVTFPRTLCLQYYSYDKKQQVLKTLFDFTETEFQIRTYRWSRKNFWNAISVIKV